MMAKVEGDHSAAAASHSALDEWMAQLLWPLPAASEHAVSSSAAPLIAHYPHLAQQRIDAPPKKEKMIQTSVALETKSVADILDDGYKWRKYGQKPVKNSKHPRSYYRCSMDGCPVKKHVERSTRDPSMVVTTYYNLHNHNIPMHICTEIMTLDTN
ncbi:hypothetical protein GOP47_0006389 [Adiantum capillus-veneris]|uniref:WRKY domain-containing protein n=1 Tax=Adiantum capillus-veneris TaxID=13818 RepID=A0A9D4V2Z6_ADICA|nr:hypothetical protein GOP47_0006389 [Adiantum capillus-veneris]